MVGGETMVSEECVRFNSSNTPQSCTKHPRFVDLSPSAPHNQQIADCCKGGVLSAWGEDAANAVSSFQITVGAAGTTNRTVRMPKNYTFFAPGPGGYTCGPAKIVRQTKLITPDGRRLYNAMMTWNVTCTYSAFLGYKDSSGSIALAPGTRSAPNLAPIAIVTEPQTAHSQMALLPLLKREVLTDGTVGDNRFVIEAENLSDIVEIRVLNNKSPERIVHSVVEVCDGNLDSPVCLVVNLHMPVNSDWAHVLCALATSVARARAKQGEVLGEFDSLVRRTPGSKSTTVGFVLQQCGTLPLNLEQSPWSVVCAPIIVQITSFLAHVHPKVHPGLKMCLYIWKLFIVTTAYNIKIAFSNRRYRESENRKRDTENRRTENVFCNKRNRKLENRKQIKGLPVTGDTENRRTENAFCNKRNRKLENRKQINGLQH
nr:protein COBRA-like [Ipomoea batatas]